MFECHAIVKLIDMLEIASHKENKNSGRIRQKNERQIIAAAEVVFATHGFKGATMNSIALEAGVPKANIHYYFKNKLQLYMEVLINIIDLWDTQFNEMNASEPPAEAISQYIKAKMQFSQDYPLASRLFANEILAGAPHLKEHFKKEEYQQWFKSRTKVFRQWAKQGLIDKLAPEHIIFLIWSSTQQYADYALQISAAMGKDKLSKKDFDKAADVLTHIILKGIGAKT